MRNEVFVEVGSYIPVLSFDKIAEKKNGMKPVAITGSASPNPRFRLGWFTRLLSYSRNGLGAQCQIIHTWDCALIFLSFLLFANFVLHIHVLPSLAASATWSSGNLTLLATDLDLFVEVRIVPWHPIGAKSWESVVLLRMWCNCLYFHLNHSMKHCFYLVLSYWFVVYFAQAFHRGGKLKILLDQQNHRVLLQGKAVNVMQGSFWSKFGV
ncbi:hypothetical protein DITRI_Ditri11bG0095500 [Diplodiscus trichospermus]